MSWRPNAFKVEVRRRSQRARMLRSLPSAGKRGLHSHPMA
jgi:hypothetical protein